MLSLAFLAVVLWQVFYGTSAVASDRCHILLVGVLFSAFFDFWVDTSTLVFMSRQLLTRQLQA